MKNLIFLGLFISIYSSAQTSQKFLNDAELKKLSADEQIQYFKEKILENEEYIKASDKTLAQIKADQEKTKSKLEALTKLKTNRPEILSETLNEVEAKLKEIPFHKRILSSKADLYRCVKDSLKREGISNSKYCQIRYSVDLDASEKRLFEGWDEKIGIRASEVDQKIKNLTMDAQTLEKRLENHPKNVSVSQSVIEHYQKKAFVVEQNERDKGFLQDKQQYVNCDANTPEINLEEKIPFPGAKFQGPFHNIPRDNQDGLGTCYANVAKNYLVALSGGENIASFLDTALQYKKQFDSSFLQDGIEAGGSCGALDQLKKNGYCPQRHSPTEVGDRNYLGEGLIAPGAGSVYGQEKTIDLIRGFLKSKDDYFKKGGEVSEKILKEGKTIVAALKANPDIRFPLPGLQQSIPGPWMLKKSYYKLPQEVQKKADLASFQEEHDKVYKDFYPKYVQKLLDGESAGSIFNAYKETMTPFIKKYGLENDLEDYNNAFEEDRKNSLMRDPDQRKSLIASLEFLKKVTGKEAISNNEYALSCYEDAQFLGDFQKLVTYLNDNKMNTDELFDEKGNYRDPASLTQLAVAPACLNPANRQKINFDFVCETGGVFINDLKKSDKTEAEKIRGMRERVVLNLLNGSALGNTFERHINTIVGMRFNKERGACEYNIRESQTGTSSWQSEKDIFSKIESLTEVRKK